MLIIPAIDLMDGKVVRLKRGDFTESKIYSDDPVLVARDWQKKGAKRIHIVDLDGAKTGECKNLNVVRDIVKELKIPVELGGGIRNFDMVQKVLDCGVRWIVLGTKALLDEGFLKDVVLSFPNRIIVSADIKSEKIYIKGWKEGLANDIFTFFKKLEDMKISSLIITDIQKDGTLKGVNIKLFSEICRKISIPVIVAGGISSLKDIEQLSSIEKVEGVIIGKALYEGRIDLEEAIKLNSIFNREGNMSDKESLVIVESPAKARTIQSFLGKGYKVSASMGHIKNLPEKKLGIDIENGFTPTYCIIKGKKKILQELKSEAKNSSQVLLAADSDREGETICAHLAEEISPVNENIFRILFHEVTPLAIKEAMNHLTSIDINKVDSGKARRVLDRLVGYKISPLLWQKVRKGLSAGRVQTVALKIIVDREKEINAFVPEEYYLVFGKFTTHSNEEFLSQLKEFKGEKITKFPKDEAYNIKTDIEKQTSFSVKNIGVKEEKRNAPPPFITSSLQQQAHRAFRFSAQKTMKIAQQLYEGVDIGKEITGLITYMRTDSFKISESAQEKAREFILQKFGNEYLPSSPPKFKARKGAQEAHEAIRPTNVGLFPEELKEYLDPAQLRIYTLVYNRFLASQMIPKIVEVTTVTIESGNYVFVSESRKTKFLGYTILFKRKEEENNDEDTVSLPILMEGENVSMVELKLEQKFTQPLPRYTEGTLIRKLEEEGIGRPSTYVPIMNTIKDRDYIRSVKGTLYPTELGTAVVGLLVENFPSVFYEKFTSQMEQNLDEVEEGKRKWIDIVKDFYTSFEPVLNKASSHMKNLKKEREKPTGEKCPECGGDLILKEGRYGQFIACSNFPNCRYTKRMLKKAGMKCPNENCSGEIVEMRNKRGRVFYGCSNYPQCRWSASYLPSSEKKVENGPARQDLAGGE